MEMCISQATQKNTGLNVYLKQNGDDLPISFWRLGSHLERHQPCISWIHDLWGHYQNAAQNMLQSSTRKALALVQEGFNPRLPIKARDDWLFNGEKVPFAISICY